MRGFFGDFIGGGSIAAPGFRGDATMECGRGVRSGLAAGDCGWGLRIGCKKSLFLQTVSCLEDAPLAYGCVIL